MCLSHWPNKSRFKIQIMGLLHGMVASSSSPGTCLHHAHGGGSRHKLLQHRLTVPATILARCKAQLICASQQGDCKSPSLFMSHTEALDMVASFKATCKSCLACRVLL